MTSPSSIFNFSTLRASFRPGAAAFLALILVAAAELGVRFLTPNLGWYEGLSSLNQWVARLRHELQTTQPDIWLMGNSVLAYGVDIAELERQTGKTALAMPFGGATVAGSTAMLEYYLRRVPRPPEHVAFCITKDDLNPNGERSWISETYLKYDTWRGLSLERMFRLADSRNTLMNTLKSLVLGRSTASASQPSEPSFQGVVPPEKADYMERLMRDYELDTAVFPHIQALARQYGFSVSFVLMPVSDIYTRFHDQHTSGPTCAEVHARIQRLVLDFGFSFQDLSGMAPGHYDLFSDPYHLTPVGRTQATPLVAQALTARPSAAPLKRIACIGDSITFGVGLDHRTAQSFPALLERLSQGQWEVGNFGVPSTTLLEKSGRAWIDTEALAAARAFQPDTVVILFGINDIAHPDLLPGFAEDGVSLVRRFQALPTSPQIYLCTPTPIAPARRERAANQMLQAVVTPAIREIARQTGAQVIDLQAVFPNTQRLLPDTTHPNLKGNRLIAETMFRAIDP